MHQPIVDPKNWLLSFWQGKQLLSKFRFSRSGFEYSWFKPIEAYGNNLI